MISFKMLFHPRYAAILRMIIQTLIVFVIAVIPFALNVITTVPPYSIENYGPGGYSMFNQRLKEEGFNTTRVLVSTEPLLDLPSSSVLVIAGGTKTYRQIEVERIKAFLLKGGLVFLLAHSIVSRTLASELNVTLSSSNLMETENYYKTPEIVLVNSPFMQAVTESEHRMLAISQPKAIIVSRDKVILEIKTNKTAFIDQNSDKKWSQYNEKLREYTVGVVLSRGLGVLCVISSPSFLTNDYFFAGFANINFTITLMKLYSDYMFKGLSTHVYFEESHKRWSIWSRDGLINQTYGTIVLLSQTESFIILIILLILILYYFAPKVKEFKNKPKETYKDFLREHIWSKERELYDTFGRAIRPTEEEQILASLYFQYENLPNKVYNIYLHRKLNYVKKEKMTEEEQVLFEEAIKRKLDFNLFIYLFNKLEEIQQRKW
ncbi:MAG: DUF4350 domain-containing protein [Candidatus Heimdallarchaeaceae archaeon]